MKGLQHEQNPQALRAHLPAQVGCLHTHTEPLIRNWTLGQRELTLKRPVPYLKDQHGEFWRFIFTCSEAAFKTAASEFKDSGLTCVVMVFHTGQCSPLGANMGIPAGT